MTIKSGTEREQKIRRVTIRGVVLNVLLVMVKVVAGLLIRSMALIADGVHSLSDLGTDLAVLVGARLANRPADATHPYGHRKFETIATQVIAFALFLVGFGFVWTAGNAIFRGEQFYPSFVLLIVAAVSVISKEIIFFLTRKVARETESAALYANAWHHRSDSFSSVAVLIGGVASLLGWGHADHAATIVVGFMITAVGGKLFYDGLIELTEHSADAESILAIEEILSREKGISNWHALRTRKHGAELLLDLHILVDPALTVLQGHEISHRIEEQIKKRLKKPVNILIHIEPEIQNL